MPNVQRPPDLKHLTKPTALGCLVDKAWRERRKSCALLRKSSAVYFAARACDFRRTNSPLFSAASLTKNPILGWDGSRSTTTPFSRSVSEAMGLIEATAVR